MPSSLFLDEVGIAAELSNDYPASSWALFPYPTLTSFALESQARALIVTEMSPFIMAAGCQDDHVEHSDSDTSQLRDALTKRKEKKLYPEPAQDYTTTPAAVSLIKLQSGVRNGLKLEVVARYS